MAKRIFLLLLMAFSVHSIIAQNKFWRLPYDYNAFTNSSTISWALETYTEHAFQVDSPKSLNIYSYLVTGQKNGSLKCYLPNDYREVLQEWGKQKAGDYFTEINYPYNNRFESMYEPLNLTQFHEIFFLEQHQLKSHIVAAGPLYKLNTSNGVYIGHIIKSYSSLNLYPTHRQNKQDDVYFLGNTNTVLHIDSLEQTDVLKKTYSMSLPLVLWHDASKGHHQLIDIKNQSTIPAEAVMAYSPFDATERLVCVDSIVMLKEILPGEPAYQYFSDVEIEQTWYYNKSTDIFFNTINKAYLYIRYQDKDSLIYRNEKRFEIIFAK